MQGSLLAYQLDGAVGLLGRHVEAKLDEWTGKGKHRRRKYTLEGVLRRLEWGARVAFRKPWERIEDLPPPPGDGAGFADPRGLVAMGLVKTLAQQGVEGKRNGR